MLNNLRLNFIWHKRCNSLGDLVSEASLSLIVFSQTVERTTKLFAFRWLSDSNPALTLCHNLVTLIGKGSLGRYSCVFVSLVWSTSSFHCLLPGMTIAIFLNTLIRLEVIVYSLDLIVFVIIIFLVYRHELPHYASPVLVLQFSRKKEFLNPMANTCGNYFDL
eukprot:TRINITY_DN7281_c0_g4_i2.p1 TRINITY_DN7281_c0_g4~~TRINITY_DN7281_c0_g4_i2.p1  ORF type:complete len:163 (-),score=20.06 TRINITY_DN7281_c0_g4_i2:548-1036(-)